MSTVKTVIDIKQLEFSWKESAPLTLDIEQFKSENLGGNVLIVGHSNSTPELVNRLIGAEQFASMEDTDNGSLFIVKIVENRSDWYHDYLTLI